MIDCHLGRGTRKSKLSQNCENSIDFLKNTQDSEFLQRSLNLLKHCQCNEKSCIGLRPILEEEPDLSQGWTG